MNQQQPQQQIQTGFYESLQAANKISGPPTTGLFDNLKNEKSFQTPTKTYASHQQSFNHQSFYDTSALNQSGFNQSQIMSPILSANNNPSDFNKSYHNSTIQSTIPMASGFNNSNFWITVFGFPQNAVTAILSHFSQCGSILEKVCSSGNCIMGRSSATI
jgi:nuclear pore complex protein Nup53